MMLKLLMKKIEKETKENIILTKIIEVDWKNLPIDTVVMCANHIEYLNEGYGEIRHYSGLNKDNAPTAWVDGMTSETTKITYKYKYMIPVSTLK